MGKYSAAIRSNFFHVNDEDDFLEFMGRVITGDGADIEVIADRDNNGGHLFKFSADGPILGIDPIFAEENGIDDEYTAFILGLQAFVADDDAIIIIEIGMDENLDTSAEATIITANESDYFDLKSIATDRAIDMLLRP